MKWRDVLRMPVSEATRLGAEQMVRLLRTDVRDLFGSRGELTGPAPSTESQQLRVLTADTGTSTSAALAVQPRIETAQRPPKKGERRFEYQCGEVVEGLFAIEEELASRGSTRLYRARHLAWETPVLLAVPQADWLAGASTEGFLTSLASSWSACGLHPYLQYCYEIRTLHNVPCLVLELLESGTLRAWVSSGHTQPLRVAFDLAIQLCEGLVHAHERGLFHGGLSPDTVLASPDGILRIAYFGLNVPRETTVDEAYIAPERWVDETSPEQAADLFALGVCLYELFTGQRPYEITRGPRRQPVDPSCRKGESLPEPVAAMLRRCVEWEPLRRPESAREVRDVLLDAYAQRFGEPSVYARPDTRSVDAGGWNNQGMVALVQENLDQAEAAWQTALAHDPAHLEAGYNLALLRWRRGVGCDQEVLKALERARVDEERRWRLDYLMAVTHIEAGDPLAAKPLLERIAPFFRGSGAFEELLRLARRARPFRNHGRELKGHTQFVSGVSVSADGRWIASGSDDHTVVVWDALSGNPVRVLEGHEKRVSCLAMTPDATRALSGSEDFTLRLWDLQRGRCERVIELPGQVFAVAISADGRRAVSSAAGSDNFLGIDGTTVALWDLERGRLLRTFEEHTSAVKALALSPDGRYLATGSDDQTVRVWDTTTGRSIRVLRGHRHNVSCVAISADGKRIFSGSWDRSVRLWDGRTGQCLAELGGHEGIVTAVCMDGEATTAVSGSWDGSVRVWDLVGKRCTRAYDGHRGLVTSVALASNARVAVSGGWDARVRVWDLPQPGPTVCFPQLTLRPVLPPIDVRAAIAEETLCALQSAVERDDIRQALVLLRTSREQGLVEAHTLRHIERRLLPKLATERLLHSEVRGQWQWPSPPVACDAASGVALAVGQDNQLLRASEDSRTCLGAVPTEVGPVRAVAVSQDGARVACAGFGRIIAVLQSDDGRMHQLLPGHESIVTALAWVDGSCLVSASTDRSIRLWDVAKGTCQGVMERHEAPIRCLSLSPGGRLVSGDWNGEVWLWDFRTGQSSRPICRLDAPISSLVFVREELVLVGTERGLLYTFFLDAGRGEAWRAGHQGAVLDLVALWDGRRVLSSGADNSVVLWNVTSGTREAVLHEGTEPIGKIWFDDEPSSLALAGIGGTVWSYQLSWQLGPAEAGDLGVR